MQKKLLNSSSRRDNHHHPLYFSQVPQESCRNYNKKRAMSWSPVHNCESVVGIVPNICTLYRRIPRHVLSKCSTASFDRGLAVVVRHSEYTNYSHGGWIIDGAYILLAVIIIKVLRLISLNFEHECVRTLKWLFATYIHLRIFILPPSHLPRKLIHSQWQRRQRAVERKIIEYYGIISGD